MRHFYCLFAASICMPLSFGQAPAPALSAPHQWKGQVRRPASTAEQAGDVGVKAHTHLVMFMPPTGWFQGIRQAAGSPPFPGYFFETPASIACVYQLVARSTSTAGCNPNVVSTNPSGGAGAIAIVDAFDNPTAAADLALFSQQFGLPSANLTTVYAQGSQPAQDPSGGWEVEESLDVQWAHAMAPHARIFLVEAADSSYPNLLAAVALASDIVVQHGGGEVSMSWGGSEFSEETQADAFFTTPGVVYIASAGDTPGASYPSTSPNVISAGGTSISRDSISGEFLLENTWQDAGGGPSMVEPRPAFQDGIRGLVGPARGTPDLSFDANPATGVWVYDSNAVLGAGWYVVGGTSVSAPSIAGIINSAGELRASSQAENVQIYKHLGNVKGLRDIMYGTCGLNIGNFAVPGWDFCTGVGSPQTLSGK